MRDVTAFGSGLHIVTADAERAKADINSYLAGQGIEEVSVETILPNMEDVFISLIEEVDRNTSEEKDREAGNL